MIFNKMHVHGEKMENTIVIRKILLLITSKFIYVVCSIEESKDLDDLSIGELQGSMLVHEKKINQQRKRTKL